MASGGLSGASYATDAPRTPLRHLSADSAPCPGSLRVEGERRPAAAGWAGPELMSGSRDVPGRTRLPSEPAQVVAEHGVVAQPSCGLCHVSSPRPFSLTRTRGRVTGGTR